MRRPTLLLVAVATELLPLDSTANSSNMAKALHLVNTVSSPNMVLLRVSNRSMASSPSTELPKADEEDRPQDSMEVHPNKVDTLAVPHSKDILPREGADTLRDHRLLAVTRCDNGTFLFSSIMRLYAYGLEV